MTERRKYSGGCHCGAVRYEVEADLESLMACNCSLCQKRGSLLTFVQRPQFNLLSGEEALTDYQFNKKIIHHLLCPDCGIESFARGRGPDGKEMICVNARCLDGVDVNTLKLTPFYGRDI